METTCKVPSLKYKAAKEYRRIHTILKTRAKERSVERHKNSKIRHIEEQIERAKERCEDTALMFFNCPVCKDLTLYCIGINSSISISSNTKWCSETCHRRYRMKKKAVGETSSPDKEKYMRIVTVHRGSGNFYSTKKKTSVLVKVDQFEDYLAGNMQFVDDFVQGYQSVDCEIQ